jgi:hypothetical protein
MLLSRLSASGVLLSFCSLHREFEGVASLDAEEALLMCRLSGATLMIQVKNRGFACCAGSPGGGAAGVCVVVLRAGTLPNRRPRRGASPRLENPEPATRRDPARACRARDAEKRERPRPAGPVSDRRAARRDHPAAARREAASWCCEPGPCLSGGRVGELARAGEPRVCNLKGPGRGEARAALASGPGAGAAGRA